MAIRVPLQLHPDSICAVQAIEVEVSRIAPRRIGLRYFALGGADHIETGSRLGKPERTDELWKTTCFEAFVQAEGDVAYYEFNFATSGNWAAYRFDNRREGMTDAQVEAPQAEWSRQPPFVLRAAPPTREEEQEKAAFRTNDGWLGARLMLDHAMDLPLDRPWRLGLSAVIEERGGRKSWWALKHPAGAPDFHDPACFTLQLPAAR